MVIGVAVVDDGSVALRGAAVVLSLSPRHRFLGSFPAAEWSSYDPAEPPPSVLVADPFAAAGPGMSELANLGCGVSVLVMSASTNATLVRRALLTGLRGYIGKDADVGTLLAAVDAVGVGGLYLGGLTDQVIGGHEPAPAAAPIRGAPAEVEGAAPAADDALLTALTPRERDVLAMVAQGLTHKQIGMRLQLSKATIDTYVHRLRQKAGCVNKAGLTRFAMQLRLQL